MEPLIYIGPALRGPYPLPRFTVFAAGLPRGLKALCAKNPALRSLIVPASRLAEARQEASRPGSLLRTYYIRLETSPLTKGD